MPGRPSTFDYGILAPESAEIAQRAASVFVDLKATKLRSRNSWIEEGHHLSHVWEALGHGHRIGWLKAETELKEKTAERLIAAHRLIAPHLDFDNLANLPPIQVSAIYELCGCDREDVVAEFLPKILAGDRGLRKEIIAILHPAPEARKDEPDAAPIPEDDPPPRRPRDVRADALTEGATPTDLDFITEILRAIRAGVRLDDIEASVEWRSAAPEPAPAQAAEDDPPHRSETSEAAAVDPGPGAPPEPDEGDHDDAPSDAHDPPPEPEAAAEPDHGPRAHASRGTLNRDAAIARIRALMAKTVANGCTEAEAMLAADKVKDLMVKYAITMTDFEIQAQTCEQRYATEKAHDVWRCAGAIAEFTGTKTWLHGDCIVFFGLPHDVEVAEYLTDLCRNAMEAGFRQYVRERKQSGVGGRASRKTFMTGMADRLAQRIYALAEEHNATATTGSGTSLVVVKNDVVGRQYDALGLKLRFKTERRFKVDQDALSAAYAAAERVNLTDGVGHDRHSHLETAA